MVVDHEKRYIFVSVAKTGSTSIRRRLGFFKDPPPLIYHMFLKDMIMNLPDCKDYFKFAFVRNPYDRAYSTYMNLKYGGHPSWADPIRKKNSFEEFVLDLESSEYSQFIHLRPQFEYVAVDGEIGVDFLGRFENLQEDFRIVEAKIGLLHGDLERYRITIPPNPLPVGEEKKYTQEMKDVILRFYKKDFESLGYDK